MKVNEHNEIQLETTCILNVPIKMFNDPFSFVVNGEEYKTTKIVADLISPRICSIHLNDPTYDLFTFNTKHQGNFSIILDLSNFMPQTIHKEDLPFVSEVVDILGSCETKLRDENDNIDINEDNIFNLIKIHELNENFYTKSYKKDVEFISSHFFDLCENHLNDLSNLKYETLNDILSHERFTLKDEDQLIDFINYLYKIDTNFSVFYEYVYFVNVSSKSVKNFTSLVDKNDLTEGTWRKLCDRLNQDTIENETDDHYPNKRRYGIIEKVTTFSMNKKNYFSGIFNYLQTKLKDDSEKTIDFLADSVKGNLDENQPQNVILFNDSEKSYISENCKGNNISIWIKDKRFIPKGYTIRSCDMGQNDSHPRSWVIEGSIDQNSWIIIDQQQDCQFLNGPSLVHYFTIDNKDEYEFSFISIRQTGPAWDGSDVLAINSFEIYGTLIETYKNK